MKKALLIVGAAALVVWIASWFWDEKAVATSAAKAWPDGLGTLDTVAARYPAQRANDAARKLTALAEALPKTEAIGDYVRREVARGELTIAAAPQLPDVTSIRDLLLREPVVWPREGGVGDIGDGETTERRGMQMRVARALVADALSKARANDTAAWDDLHAVWNLARSLDAQPQMMFRTAAFSMARMINAVAWKMPLPAPAWLGDLQRHDELHMLLEGFQNQTASYWLSYSHPFPTKPLAGSVDGHRQIAEQLARATQCDVKPPVNEWGTDLTSLWRRAFRYRAEREATANALRVREGKSIETKSGCSDGAWRFDGTTLRFDREIATTADDKPLPLVLRLRPVI